RRCHRPDRRSSDRPALPARHASSCSWPCDDHVRSEVARGPPWSRIFPEPEPFLPGCRHKERTGQVATRGDNANSSRGGVVKRGGLFTRGPRHLTQDVLAAVTAL